MFIKIDCEGLNLQDKCLNYRIFEKIQDKIQLSVNHDNIFSVKIFFSVTKGSSHAIADNIYKQIVSNLDDYNVHYVEKEFALGFKHGEKCKGSKIFFGSEDTDGMD